MTCVELYSSYLGVIRFSNLITPRWELYTSIIAQDDQRYSNIASDYKESLGHFGIFRGLN